MPENFELTPMELLVLKCLADGLNSIGIAEKLSRSPNTISQHAGAARRKLQRKTMAGCVARAIREGVIE